MSETELPVPQVPTAPALPDPPTVQFQRPPSTAEPKATSGRLSGMQAGQMGIGFSIATALISSIIGGVIFGMLVDRYLIRATTPWGLIVGFMLGMISGFANMMKLARRVSGD